LRESEIVNGTTPELTTYVVKRRSEKRNNLSNKNVQIHRSQAFVCVPFNNARSSGVGQTATPED
jgi:hypothetical protein